MLPSAPRATASTRPDDSQATAPRRAPPIATRTRDALAVAAQGERGGDPQVAGDRGRARDPARRDPRRQRVAGRARRRSGASPTPRARRSAVPERRQLRQADPGRPTPARATSAAPRRRRSPPRRGRRGPPPGRRRSRGRRLIGSAGLGAEGLVGPARDAPRRPTAAGPGRTATRRPRARPRPRPPAGRRTWTQSVAVETPAGRAPRAAPSGALGDLHLPDVAGVGRAGCRCPSARRPRASPRPSTPRKTRPTFWRGLDSVDDRLPALGRPSGRSRARAT